MIRNKRFGDEWSISWEEYKELSYFCLQYHRKKAEAARLLTIRISTPPVPTDSKGNGVMLPHGKGGISDPVAATAVKRERLLKDCDMIDKAARLAGGDLAPWLIKAVTTRGDVRGVLCGCPASERVIWRLRRSFFCILKRLREET